MKKPDISPLYPGTPPVGNQSGPTPKAVVHQPAPVAAASSRPNIPPAPPAEFSGPAAPYVDPYLFEIGYYTSRAEYNELQRTTPSRIRMRAEVENARPKRRSH